MAERLEHGRRFEGLKMDNLTPAQKVVAERVIRGPRGSLGAPWNGLLRSPGVADAVDRLGDYVRFRTGFSARVNELVILTLAREWDAPFPWYSHVPAALKAGLERVTIEEIAQGRRPRGITEEEHTVRDFVLELARTRTAGDALYANFRDRFGEKGVVDMIGLMGYYFMLSLVLTVDSFPMPPYESLPLPSR